MLLATGGQPVVREGVPELMGVNSRDPGICAAAFEHLPHAGVGHPSLLAEPEWRGLRRVVTTTETQIAAQRVG
jgi:hypothetical protein